MTSDSQCYCEESAWAVPEGEKMRGVEPMEEGASIFGAEGLAHTKDKCLAQRKSWNWDSERPLNR